MNIERAQHGDFTAVMYPRTGTPTVDLVLMQRTAGASYKVLFDGPNLIFEMVRMPFFRTTLSLRTT
jgi:hypothetical protein